MKKKVILTSLLLIAIVGVTGYFGINSNQDSSAANLSNFNPENIIPDAVFTNNNAMSATGIQNFLNSKNSVCLKDLRIPGVYDLNGNGWIDDGGAEPYGYNGGIMSAAELIKTVADIYHINPQVILVTLQKEQGLITRTDCTQWSYLGAMGAGIPDFGANDPNATRSFTAQVDYGASYFRGYLNAMDRIGQAGYNYGYSYRPGPGNIVKFNPNSACGSTVLNIANKATAALYIYTPYQPNAYALGGGTNGDHPQCGAFGNMNFWRFFTDWFGNTNTSPEDCNSKVNDVACVWQLFDPHDGSELLTSSKTERDNVISNLGWSYSGIAFYAFSKQVAGSVPVYRINFGDEHFFTANEDEKNSLTSNTNNKLEGIVFYVHPSTTTTNISYRVNRYVGNGKHIITRDTSLINQLLHNDYKLEGIAFNTPSGVAPASFPEPGRAHVYRLVQNEHMYTTDISERDSMLLNGWRNEGVLTDVPDSATSKPIYRLVKNYHIFTMDTGEKNQLQKDGWKLEGIGWHSDDSTQTVFRFVGNGKYFLTADIGEASSITNRNWTYQTTLFGKSQTPNVVPIYRLASHEHFYTASQEELLSINNNGWRYEGIAFYANPNNTGKPVYRLAGNGEHFYTANLAERDAVIKAGWRYEGIAFYANPNNTGKPVYRLAGNGEHFYTANLAERDAVIKAGWRYEGIAFYASN